MRHPCVDALSRVAVVGALAGGEGGGMDGGVLLPLLEGSGVAPPVSWVVAFAEMRKMGIHHPNPAGAPYCAPTKIKAALIIHRNLCWGILGVPMEAGRMK